MARSARRHRRGRRGSTFLTLTMVALLTAAGVAELTSSHPGSGPPRPAAAVDGDLPADQSTSTAAMAYSVPAHIDIPAVNVNADIITVDANADGSLGTPPLDNAKVAAWYDGSVTPGQIGTSVIDAHVDSTLMKDSRGAFYSLGLAKPGMEIDITRADHSVAVFTVDEVQQVLKSQFPTDQVYADTAYPSLRLITCGGDFDTTTHEYLGNTIVYAHWVAPRPLPRRAE